MGLGEAGSPAPPAPKPAVKFALLQALRGIAATWVVLFHVYQGQSIDALAGALPGPVTYAVFGYGSAGVAIFFVLSGFVIAHSLHDKPLSGGDYGRFLIRRSVRLDPTYWFSILVTLVVAAVLAKAHHQGVVLPSAPVVAAHLFYLQELLRLPEIQIVYWTLTYEVQFYAVLAAQVLATRLARHRAGYWREAPMIVLTVLAFASAAWTGPPLVRGLFVNLWYGFFAGVLAYRAGVRGGAPWVLIALAAVMLVAARFEDGVFATPCAVTALGLFAAARLGWLERGLDTRALQALGAISYSLYLLHVPVTRLTAGVLARMWSHSIVHDFVGMIVQLTAAIAAAVLAWWAVERPSHRLAQRIPQTRRAVANQQSA